MRCQCCSRNLNDFESTRKHADTGEYLDICNRCIKGLGIKTSDRPDLNPEEQAPEDYDFLEDDFLELINFKEEEE